MPLFAYKVVHEDGTSASNEVLAADAGDLQRDLGARGYLVQNIAEEKTGSRGGQGHATDFLIFSQPIIILVKEGLLILQSLEIINNRTGKPRFCTVFESIIQEIISGKALLEAVADYPLYFFSLYAATVRAGEKATRSLLWSRSARQSLKWGHV